MKAGSYQDGDVHARLRRDACKVTGPRQAILKVLMGQSRPMTNKEIFQALPKGGGDLATVYRSVQMLERLGLVKRFQFDNGAARYSFMGEGEGRHHHLHHLVCTRCTQIVEIGECLVTELQAQVAARSKFAAVTHRLEFFGVCPSCQ